MEFVQLLADDCKGLGSVVLLIKNLFDIIKIVVPIILIIYGAIDLTRAVMASDDKEIKTATSKLIKRAVAAVAVFFIVTLVDVVMGLVADSTTDNKKGTLLSCWRTPNATQGNN